jgi:cytidylate kinase
MSVITISRQLGVQGLAISTKIASQLGYSLYWREIINQAALRSGAPEVALAMIDELGLLDLTPSEQELQAYHQAIRQVILEFAAQDNTVILGRAGQMILQDQPACLHIRLFAPPEFRTQALASRNNLPIKAARAQITASDQYRRQYLRQFFQVEWDDPTLYHLVINMAHFRLEQAVDLILFTNQQLYGGDTRATQISNQEQFV